MISKLNLKLMGTVVATEGSAAFVVSPKGSDQDVFFVGDTILPGVKLTAIETTHIVIADHGKNEKVTLEDSTGGIETATLQSSPAQAPASPSREIRVAAPPANRPLPPRETMPARAVKQNGKVKSPTSLDSPDVGRSTSRSRQR